MTECSQGFIFVIDSEHKSPDDKQSKVSFSDKGMGQNTTNTSRMFVGIITVSS